MTRAQCIQHMQGTNDSTRVYPTGLELTIESYIPLYVVTSFLHIIYPYNAAENFLLQWTIFIKSVLQQKAFSFHQPCSLLLRFTSFVNLIIFVIYSQKLGPRLLKKKIALFVQQCNFFSLGYLSLVYALLKCLCKNYNVLKCKTPFKYEYF